MTDKTTLVSALDAARDALLWKLDGLSERDQRRPLTPTGTNLLGLVKHVALVESGYFGDVFGRPFPERVDGAHPDDPPNADMYAAEHESAADVLALFDRVRAHADATIAALDLDATGRVAWWPAERADVTLGRILVHVVAEEHRHAGASPPRSAVAPRHTTATSPLARQGGSCWWSAARLLGR